MTRENALYIVDVYVPNEGEPESALELVIFKVLDQQSLPQVYVHTYIRPELPIFNRIRWNQAQSFGIERAMVQGSDYPTFREIVNADYLRDKSVVCFCANFEPIQTLIANCPWCFSVLNRWQDVFAGDDGACQATTIEQMLDYMGLPVVDSSNCHYTPLMKRARALMAIWSYLHNSLRLQQRPPQGYSEFSQSIYWPLADIPEPWYDPQAKELTDIPAPAICDYFSERLPEYVHWDRVRLYIHDWRFARERSFEVKIVDQDAMLNFIFYRLFALPKRLMVLTFYALCQQRIKFARIIALHQGQFNTLQQSVKEDFAAFLLTHLADFIVTKHKYDLICALVEQFLQNRFEQQQAHYDFDELYQKHELNQRKLAKTRQSGGYYPYNEDEDLIFVRESLSCNRNIFWFRELRERDTVLLRRFTIQGNVDEYNECIDHITDKINELLAEAKNPFAPCWVPAQLRQWIEFITGFAWSDLAHVPSPNDAASLTEARKTLCEIITQRSRQYFYTYNSNFRQVIEGINDTPDGEHTVLAFMFQGIAYEFDVNKSAESSGFFSKLRKIFS
ncbi:MAG TPA: hypothetical protein H9898_07440 [Candidatus Anaerobiospirillum stercoravium]|nr:hypothetical protein [Candidatus Anaerobiospirillum stercoravium]